MAGPKPSGGGTSVTLASPESRSGRFNISWCRRAALRSFSASSRATSLISSHRSRAATKCGATPATIDFSQRPPTPAGVQSLDVIDAETNTWLQNVSDVRGRKFIGVCREQPHLQRRHCPGAAECRGSEESVRAVWPRRSRLHRGARTRRRLVSVVPAAKWLKGGADYPTGRARAGYSTPRAMWLITGYA